MAKYDAAIKADPKLALAYYGRGLLLATRERNYNRAIADFDAVIALNRNDPYAFFNRGYAHFGKHEYELAVMDYSTAL